MFYFLGRSRVRPAQHQVEAISERQFFFRQAQVETGDHAMFRLVGNRLENRIVCQHGVAFEIHLGHESRHERRPEKRKVNVRGTPGIRVIVPWISPRFYGQEAVFSVFVREDTAVPVEIGVERRAKVVETVACNARRRWSARSRSAFEGAGFPCRRPRVPRRSCAGRGARRRAGA